MSLLDQTRAYKLIQLARDRFDPDLSDGESKVLRDSASSLDFDEPTANTLRPPIRPEFVCWLATEPDAALHIGPKGLRAYGVTLAGKLDLEECSVLVRLDFRRCTFEGGIDFSCAESRSFFLTDCTVKGSICANGATVRGPLDLHGTYFSAEVCLKWAHIKGLMNCNGSRLLVSEGNAFSADGANFESDVFMSDGFESSGTICLYNAHIEGILDLCDAKLRVNKGDAISADMLQVGNLFMRGGFESTGPIHLLFAKIRGQLSCNGAKIRVSEGSALIASGIEVNGGLELADGFEASGKIDLTAARIKGYFDCTGANLLVKNGYALTLHGAEIEGDVTLAHGFQSTGTVSLSGALIKGSIDCTGAKLLLKVGYGLLAHDAKIQGNVFLCNGFQCSGTISLHGAEIGGDLIFYGAEIARVNCKNLILSGDMQWLGIEKSRNPVLDLTGAKLKNLDDDRESWPSQGNLLLDGLSYSELTLREKPTAQQSERHWLPQEIPLEAGLRIEWLMLQSTDLHTEPQPWVFLANHIGAKGDRNGAKYVLFRFSRLQAEALEWHPLLWIRRAFSKVERIAALLRSPRSTIRSAWHIIRHPNRTFAIGFAWLERAPSRILYPITLTLLLGWLVFGYAAASGALAPTEAEAYKAFTSGKPMPAAYPTLNPCIYTLENAVPLVKLGQDEKWAPDLRHTSVTLLTNYWLLMWVRWALIISGWFQATVLAAALLRRFKQE